MRHLKCTMYTNLLTISVPSTPDEVSVMGQGAHFIFCSA